MRRAAVLALSLFLPVLALVPGAGLSAGPASAPPFAPSVGHRLAGFALDREWLALAEDPAATGRCPIVRLVSATGGRPQTLTRPAGPTCRLGGRFWMRPGDRAVGLAIEKGIWVVRHGTTAIAVKGSPDEPEEVLGRVTAIEPGRGPFLGPVVATNWLRLFARYVQGPGGTLAGKVVSGNRRTLWSATGPVLPLGLDDEEHAVSVGSDGAIAMWHAHGARYGRVETARAKAAAVDHGVVAVLRSDGPRLDVRGLAGKLVASWPTAHDAKPLLDAEGGIAVYLAGGSVHAIDLATGTDRVVARIPRGTALVDAQIERRFIAYAYRGGSAGAGRVVLLRRQERLAPTKTPRRRR